MDERARVGDQAWRRWGPYLSERAWGTVREDYSEAGEAWQYLPHDHARSRSYRWSEDGMAGLCDDQQFLCLALALWNGRDPILKERMFGLAGNEGNHGEDAKECWWFLDSTPTHSWMRWRYAYPQAAFPYAELVAENSRRGRDEPEYELLDTKVFDGGWWEVTVEYAKASPDDIVMRVVTRNAGDVEDTLHVLPTLWFRNTWSWADDVERPSLREVGRGIVADHPALGRYTLAVSGQPELLFCENESNGARLWGRPPHPYPKDGINDHVVSGAETVNPDRAGTKAAAWYRLSVAPGATAELRVRLTRGSRAGSVGASSTRLLSERAREADEFYASLTPAGASSDEALVLRQAFAGMLWSKQFYHLDVSRWLDGDPAQPPPPEGRRMGRNADWRHLSNRDVISMPDPWEYPWYAAWDLAFHCITLAHVDPEFAKDQLSLLCREWYMHPNGQLPAYEWSFGDVNPPVHSWCALRVFEIDGSQDIAFLERIFHKLLLNFTWWVNRKDGEGNNLFQGGFLGLDNIGPFDRSAGFPAGGVLEQSDGTAWMATYCLSMLEMALTLAHHDAVYEDVATKFFEHFVYIASAMDNQGLWDEQDGFYYDMLHLAGAKVPIRCRSMVGLIPLFAVTVLEPDLLERLPGFAKRLEWFLRNKPEAASVVSHIYLPGNKERRLLSVVDPSKLARVLHRMLDEDEFLSPHGVRSLSRRHLDDPFELELDGFRFRVDYEPAESTTGMFGGNSNWRGPVWMPLNYLITEALRRFYLCLGEDFTVELPTGSGRQVCLAEVADELSDRVVSIFLEAPDGRRPLFGDYDQLQPDPSWRDQLLFHEYFHGDTGAGLGASHQTGWTGLVAELIARRT